MSFFDDSKTLGWTLFLLGIVLVLSGIITMADGFGGAAGDIIGYIIVGIGGVLAGLIYFGFGNKLRNGSSDDKMSLLTQFVTAVGTAIVVAGFFNIIGDALIEFAATTLVVDIIWFLLGFVVLWAASKMGKGGDASLNKLLWIILLVIFVIEIILQILAILDLNLGSIAALLYLIVYLFMLVYLLDGNVKKQMGI